MAEAAANTLAIIAVILTRTQGFRRTVYLFQMRNPGLGTDWNHIVTKVGP